MGKTEQKVFRGLSELLDLKVLLGRPDLLDQ
jgi:hypothetical protein